MPQKCEDGTPAFNAAEAQATGLPSYIASPTLSLYEITNADQQTMSKKADKQQSNRQSKHKRLEQEATAAANRQKQHKAFLKKWGLS